MAPEIFWIPEVTIGRLAIMARPRSGEWLRDEVAGWCNAGLNAVVCLLEASEVRELALHDEPALCESSRIAFISFPITDRGVPSSVTQTAELADRVVSLLREGSSVAVHCRAGIGRSSLIAGCVLLKLGFRREDVFPMLSRARGLQVPDTQAQMQWLSLFGREGLSRI
jgi:protein-tyrosine phosphatase